MAVLDEQDRIQALREAVEEFFDRDGTKHQPFDENDVARAGYSVDTKFGHATVFFHAHSDQLLFKFMLPISADETERDSVGEFLLRANYGLKIGGFDFDYRDGEISYRISLFCGREDFHPPTYDQINFSVIIGLMMVEKYGNALVKVMFGLLEPEEAIELAESDN